MNSYGRPIKRLPRKGLACQCKQDLFGFWEAVVFTSEDNCWVEGMCAKRTFPTLNNRPRYVNTTADKNPKQIELNIVKLKSLSWI